MQIAQGLRSKLISTLTHDAVLLVYDITQVHAQSSPKTTST